MTDENHNHFGGALRRLRRERRLSLNDVSVATGISASFLSLVENERSDISISRLMKLAAFFDVHVSDLLPPGLDRDPIVVRASERRHIGSPHEGIDIYLLAPDSERRFLPLIAEFGPGARFAELTQHEGDEYVYVLEGRICLEVEGHEPVILARGDGAFYRADRAHTVATVDAESASVLAVASPPHL
jgi:transcriptional regulator with XRE-family HTH domain